MIRSPELPGMYWLDAGVFRYASKGLRVPVWVERVRDYLQAQPLRDGEPVGNPVTVSRRVLYRGDG